MPGANFQPTYSPTLFTEHTLAFEGTSIVCILIGVYFAIAGINISLLRKRRRRILLLYTIFQSALTTLYCAMVLFTTPRRSLGIFQISGSSSLGTLPMWSDITIDIAIMMNTWTSDAFLLYRCYVICLADKYALALPTLLYLATVGSSLAWLVVDSIPENSYDTHTVELCYWCCSTAMNVCTSCLISVRLWMHRRAISKVLGSQRSAFYLSYIAMTLESTLLYTVTAVIVLVVFSLNSPLRLVFIPMLGIIQAIAPSLIIYRIARGISFETDECGSMLMSSVHFVSAE